MAGSGRQNADPILIAALLSGATPAEAATQAGVSERTVRRRLLNPAFRARLNAAGDDMIAASARILSMSARASCSMLKKCFTFQSFRGLHRKLFITKPGGRVTLISWSGRPRARDTTRRSCGAAASVCPA